MHTESRYEENTAFHTITWIEHNVENNQLILKIIKYNFWLQPNNIEWRCIKEIIFDRQCIYYANSTKIE